MAVIFRVRLNGRKIQDIRIAAVKKLRHLLCGIRRHALDVLDGAVVKGLGGVLSGNLPKGIAEHVDLAPGKERQQDQGHNLDD